MRPILPTKEPTRMLHLVTVSYCSSRGIWGIFDTEAAAIRAMDEWHRKAFEHNQDTDGYPQEPSNPAIHARALYRGERPNAEQVFYAWISTAPYYEASALEKLAAQAE